MSAVTRRAALALCLALALPAWADDPPKPAPPLAVSPPPAGQHSRSAGTVTGKLDKVSDKGGTIAVQVPELERDKNSGRRRLPTMHVAEKTHDYTLADDVKVRWHDLPKGADGKARRPSQEEYQKLREPVGTPGYRAEMSDLHTGQQVKLYLGKAGKDDKPVVTVIMILADAPKSSGKDEKTKK
jgi:hypothetical protein